MPFKFLLHFSKTSDLHVKLAILYLKIPDTDVDITQTVPEKVDMYSMLCVERFELLT